MKTILHLVLFLSFTATLFAQDNCLQFDGVDQRVKLANNTTLDQLNGATDYTIEFWVKPNADLVSNKVILKRYYSFSLTLYRDSDPATEAEDTDSQRRIYFTHYANDGTGTYTNIYVNTIDNCINLHQWNHVAVVNDSADDTFKIFVNGVDVTLNPQSALTLESDPVSGTYVANLYLGYGGSGTYPNAYIDKVRVSKVAIDETSFQTAVTDSDYAVDPNTVVLMNLNEGTGLLTVNEVDAINADLQTETSPPSWVNVGATLAYTENNTTEFSIFPNPVNSEYFTIQAKNNETIQEVELVDILGKSVKRIEFNTAINSENINIDKLNSGIYIVKIKTDAGIGTQKIVIE